MSYNQDKQPLSRLNAARIILKVPSVNFYRRDAYFLEG